MATKKISQLEAITEAEDSDVLVIVDVSAGTTNKITKGNLLLGSGHSVEMTLDPQTYQLVLKLKNAAGTELSTQSVDLPNENAVTGITYNNKELIITKQVGEPSTVDLSPLIDGLVTETDFNTFTEALAETIQGINETIGAINVKNENQDLAIEENYKEITKLKEKIQRYRNQLPRVEGEGYEATLNDTIEDDFIQFDIEGHSEQETTEGYNLAEINETDWTYLDNGNITNKASNAGKILSTFEVKANQTYNVYLKLISKPNADCTFSATGGAFSFTRIDNFNLNQVYKNTFTATEDKTLEVKRWGEAISNTFEFQFWVVKGENETYEKYTNGASPNPSYEQPIKSTGENVNLLDFDVITTSRNGVDISFSNGKILLNGTSNATFDIYLGNTTWNSKADEIKNLLNNKKGSFTLSTTAPTKIENYWNMSSSGYAQNTCTITESDTINTFFLRILNGKTFNNELIGVKLEPGTTATPYSPYGMGSITEKIVNKNLAYIEAEGKFRNFTNGNFTTNVDYNSYIAEVEENTDYMVKSFNHNAFSNLCFFDQNMNRISGSGFNGTTNRQFTTVENCKYATIAVRNTENQFMITKGTTIPIDYVAHEEQTYSIPTQQPFKSSKDKTVRDCFVKKSDGWYERHKINRYTFTGNETLTKNSNVVYSLRNFDENVLQQNYQDVMSNIFKGKNSWSALQSEDYSCAIAKIGTIADTFFMYSSEFENMTQAQILEMLTGNYFDYQLAEPLDLPCTEEQIAILENIPETFKGQTNVITMDEIAAYLKVAGLKDLNKMFSDITNAITAQGANV